MQSVFNAVFHDCIPRSAITLRPKISDVVSAAQLAANQMVELKMALRPTRFIVVAGEAVTFKDLALHCRGNVASIASPLLVAQRAHGDLDGDAGGECRI